MSWSRAASEHVLLYSTVSHQVYIDFQLHRPSLSFVFLVPVYSRLTEYETFCCHHTLSFQLHRPFCLCVSYLTLSFVFTSTYVQVTVPLFSTYFTDCDHSSLTDNMLSTMSLKFRLFSFLSRNKSKPTETVTSSHGQHLRFLLLFLCSVRQLNLSDCLSKVLPECPDWRHTMPIIRFNDLLGKEFLS